MVTLKDNLERRAFNAYRGGAAIYTMPPSIDAQGIGALDEPCNRRSSNHLPYPDYPGQKVKRGAPSFWVSVHFESVVTPPISELFVAGRAIHARNRTKHIDYSMKYWHVSFI